jgi:hypothetical protein
MDVQRGSGSFGARSGWADRDISSCRRSGSSGSRAVPGAERAAMWRAGGRRVRLARLPEWRWKIPCDIATEAGPRWLIVSGFLTIDRHAFRRSPDMRIIAGAFRGMRPWESVASLAGWVGAWSCRGRVLGRARFGFVRQRGCEGSWATMRSASVQRVHATLGIRGALWQGGRGRGPATVGCSDGVSSGSFGEVGGGGDAARCRASGSFGSTMYFSARMPCLSACCAERALPSGVFGPSEFAPFLRLSSAGALLTERATCGACTGHGGLASWLERAGEGRGGGPGCGPREPYSRAIPR